MQVWPVYAYRAVLCIVDYVLVSVPDDVNQVREVRCMDHGVVDGRDNSIVQHGI